MTHARAALDLLRQPAMLALTMSKPAARIVVLITACLCATAVAGPAPWYKWRSKVDGKQVCAQTPLGPGWEQAAGPFRDSHCTRLLKTQ